MALVTGSRVYGIPKPNSDIDLVVLVTDAEIAILKSMADSVDSGDDSETYADGDEYDSGKRCLRAVLRFGALNLLCVTDPVAYAVWQMGTAELKRYAPVSRETAVNMFQLMQCHCGVNKPYPTVSMALQPVGKS